MWLADMWVRLREAELFNTGNRSATFPSQLLGWDVDVANTVQFSNHTGYGRWGGLRFDAEHLRQLFEGMDQNGLLTQGRVLTGYTPSPEALATVESLISTLRERKPDMIYLLDPVMGDMDRGMYVNPDVLPIYRRMLRLSTIITPNQFEAQVLTDTHIASLESLQRVLEKLHVEFQVPNVLITSVELPDEALVQLGASSKMPDGSPAMLLVGSSWEGRVRPWTLQFPTLGEYFSGVGDLFAALTLARFATSVDELPEPARALHGISAVEENECTLPIARAVMLAVASLQQVLHRTRATMMGEAPKLGVDPLQPAHLADIETRVKVMRLRELRIVQSAREILQPDVRYRPRWALL